MEIHPLGKSVVVHGVEHFPVVMRRAVRSDQLDPLGRQFGVERGDVLRPDQLEYFLRLADRMPVGQEQIMFQRLPEIVFLKKRTG